MLLISYKVFGRVVKNNKNYIVLEENTEEYTMTLPIQGEKIKDLSAIELKKYGKDAAKTLAKLIRKESIKHLSHAEILKWNVSNKSIMDSINDRKEFLETLKKHFDINTDLMSFAIKAPFNPKYIHSYQDETLGIGNYIKKSSSLVLLDPISGIVNERRIGSYLISTSAINAIPTHNGEALEGNKIDSVIRKSTEIITIGSK